MLPSSEADLVIHLQAHAEYNECSPRGSWDAVLDTRGKLSGPVVDRL